MQLFAVENAFLFLSCLLQRSTANVSYNTSSLETSNFRSNPENLKHHVLTEVQKALILDRHNELRRIVDPPAANMLQMSWDDDLEKLATEYSRRCSINHNPDRKLQGFSYVGENIYMSSGYTITDKYGAVGVDAWDSENVNYEYASRQCKPGKICNHYTQTSWAKSYKVGCGITKCDQVVKYGLKFSDVVILVCNYAPGSIAGGLTYVQGNPCSKCPEGFSCTDRLCSNSTLVGSGDVRTAELWKYLSLLIPVILLISIAFYFK